MNPNRQLRSKKMKRSWQHCLRSFMKDLFSAHRAFSTADREFTLRYVSWQRQRHSNQRTNEPPSHPNSHILRRVTLIAKRQELCLLGFFFILRLWKFKYGPVCWIKAWSYVWQICQAESLILFYWSPFDVKMNLYLFLHYTISNTLLGSEYYFLQV